MRPARRAYVPSSGDQMSSRADRRSEHSSATNDRRPRLSDARVLVVDDDEDARELLAEILRYRGAAPIAVSDVGQALTVLRTERVDAVITDYAMPGDDGLSLLAAMRTDPQLRSLPAVMVSGQDQGGDIAAGARSLSAFFLAKPFHVEDVVSTLERSLEELALSGDGAMLELAREGASSIVIVEPDEEHRGDFSAALAADGWDVRAVATAEAALAEIDRVAPDLLISELSLPTLSARAMARALRADPKTEDLAIIAMSSGALPSSRLLSAFDSYLAKPLPLDRLREMVRAIAGRAR